MARLGDLGNGRRGRDTPRGRSAVTLLELLLVILLIAILAAVVLPTATSGVPQQLESVARIVAADLNYVRNLAVTHNSTYRVRFLVAENRYVIEHHNSDPRFQHLDRLPRFPFAQAQSSPQQQIVDLDELPLAGPPVRLAAVVQADQRQSQIDAVDFGPLGELAGGKRTVIWLAAGTGAQTKYISIRIHPVTGLVHVGTITGRPALLNSRRPTAKYR